jgi:hypothetical protein
MKIIYSILSTNLLLIALENIKSAGSKGVIGHIGDGDFFGDSYSGNAFCRKTLAIRTTLS